MKERIQHIIKAESLTNLQFAQLVDISPASVTHLLAGRNNPSIEIIAKIARCFPHYNLRWLILGEGNIYVTPTHTSATIEKSTADELLFSSNDATAATSAPQEPRITPQAEGVKLIVCLPDGTYKEYIRQ